MNRQRIYDLWTLHCDFHSDIARDVVACNSDLVKADEYDRECKLGFADHRRKWAGRYLAQAVMKLRLQAERAHTLASEFERMV